MGEELEAASAEDLVGAPHLDEPPQPVELRRRRSVLGLHVHGLIIIDRVEDHRLIQRGGIGPGEAGIPVARPLHRGPDAVPIAEVDVIAHADLVSVVQDRAARQREQQAMHQLDLVAAAVHERRQPAADSQVQPHPGVLGIFIVHIIAVIVGHHLEGQLVVIAQKQRPLAGQGISGIWLMISVIGRWSSRRMAMNNRGISGKLKAM